jgi:hypothetical protein
MPRRDRERRLWSLAGALAGTPAPDLADAAAPAACAQGLLKTHRRPSQYCSWNWNRMTFLVIAEVVIGELDLVVELGVLPVGLKLEVLVEVPVHHRTPVGGSPRGLLFRGKPEGEEPWVDVDDAAPGPDLERSPPPVPGVEGVAQVRY